jgi:hypothetical protein
MEEKNTHKISGGSLEGSRQLGRNRHISEDNIKKI